MPSKFERDMSKELQFHLDQATADYIAQGLSPAEARRRARKDFGTLDLAKEELRDTRPFRPFTGFLSDLCFTLRTLRRDWLFALIAVVTLALALGLNATVFSVVRTMLYRGFPLVKDNARLLYIQERYTLNNSSCCILYLDFTAWRAQAKSFEDMAFVASKFVSLRDGNSTPRESDATTITANTLRLLGVQPALGRDFEAADAQPGAPQVVILPHTTWQDQFGARADIVGHRLLIDGAPATVIGVTPQGFDFPAHGQFWMPLQPTADMLQRKSEGYLAFGRLAPGATQASARAELETISRGLETAFPATNKGIRPNVGMYSEFFIGPDAGMIYRSLCVGAWFVLLIACANLANWTLARSTARSREMATRIALGGGRWRILRQTFTESLLLSVAAGALGWVLALWAVRTWADATWSEYVVLNHSIDSTTKAYFALLVLFAALLFGLIPAFKTIRLGATDALRIDVRGASAGPGARRLAGTLIAVQMALAIVLIAGAGVLTRSLWTIVSADLGVTGTDKVLVGRVSVPREDFPDAASRNAFWDRLLTNLSTVSGVRLTSVTDTTPLQIHTPVPFELDGQPATTGNTAANAPSVFRAATAPGYFRAVGASLLAGRDFTLADGPDAPAVALVNQKFVDQYLRGKNPIGQRIALPGRPPTGKTWHTIVGVSSNIMQDRPLRDRFVPIVYTSFRRNPNAGAAVMVRTNVPANQIAATVRRAMETAAPNATLQEFSTLQATLGFDRDRMDLEHAELGKHAAVAPIFAAIALLLAAVGLYAVVAHSVVQRTKEIGIRIAVGAESSSILRLILGEGMKPVALGLLGGIPAALALNRILESQLVGVSPYDPLTFTAGPAILILIATIGCLLPALRATRVNPAITLRAD